MIEDYNSKRGNLDDKYIPDNVIDFEEAKERIEKRKKEEITQRIIESVKDLGW
jgi:hypothetical protein